jgi:hypothetical protein
MCSVKRYSKTNLTVISTLLSFCLCVSIDMGMMDKPNDKVR